MDLMLTAEEQTFRDNLRNWLAENVPQPWPREQRTENHPEYWQYLRNWQRRLFEALSAGVSEGSSGTEL